MSKGRFRQQDKGKRTSLRVGKPILYVWIPTTTFNLPVPDLASRSALNQDRYDIQSIEHTQDKHKRIQEQFSSLGNCITQQAQEQQADGYLNQDLAYNGEHSGD